MRIITFCDGNVGLATRQRDVWNTFPHAESPANPSKLGVYDLFVSIKITK